MSNKSKPEYSVWVDMRNRCNNPKGKNYDRYGGRGIEVYPQWDDFAHFYADMGPRPTPLHTLDRVDNEGNYTPSNCRWATRLEQSRNRDFCRISETDKAAIKERHRMGYTQTQLGVQFGVSQGHISRVILGKV